MLKNGELQPLSSEKRLSISFDICEGLKYLHEQPKPIIHRDIKSSNILLDENDVAKVIFILFIYLFIFWFSCLMNKFFMFRLVILV